MAKTKEIVSEAVTETRINFFKEIFAQYKEITRPLCFEFSYEGESYKAHVFLRSGRVVRHHQIVHLRDTQEIKLPFSAYVLFEHIHNCPFESDFLFECDESDIISPKGTIHQDNDLRESLKDRIIKKFKEFSHTESQYTPNKSHKLSLLIENSFALRLYGHEGVSYLTGRRTKSHFHQDEEFVNMMLGGLASFFNRRAAFVQGKHLYPELTNILEHYKDENIENLELFISNKSPEEQKNIYDEKSFGYINDFISYLKGTDINWKLASFIHDSKNQRDRYDFFNNGPRVFITTKKGEMKSIYPRLDFAYTYPILARFAEFEDIKKLRAKIDECKPLRHERLAVFGHVLTRDEEKYIVGKHIDNSSYMSLIMNVLPVHRWPELAENPYEITSSMSDANTLISSLPWRECLRPKDKNYINVFGRKGSFPEIFFRLLTLIDKDKIKKSTFDIQKHQKLYDMVPEKFKTICLNSFERHRNFKSLGGNLINIEKQYRKEVRIASEDSENFSRTVQNLRHYLKDNYFPVARKTDSKISSFLRNSEDILPLFYNRVVLPIAVFKSGRLGSYASHNLCKKYKKSLPLKILFYNNSLFDFIKLSQEVHDYSRQFNEAGGNVISLMSLKDMKKDDPLMEIKKTIKTYDDSIKNDKIRSQLSLNSIAEWVGLTRCTIKSENGCYLVPLISHQELVQEGRMMRNCVGWGGYTDKSRSGKSKIMSVRDENFERLTTVELSVDVDKKTLGVHQNYAYQNKDAPEKAKNAVNWFVQNINKDDLDVIDWDMISEEQSINWTEQNDKTIAEDAGYLPDSIEAINAALEPWKPYIDKSFHKVEAFFDLEEIKELAQKFQEVNVNAVL